jgi:DHA1 family bicyclomycin/chloramphenicol resistance-like MFS transporter
MSMDGHGDRAGSASALLGVLQFTTGAIVPPLVSGVVGATAVSMTTTMVAAFTAALAALAAVSSRRAIDEPESPPLVLDPEFK